jgi:preprotein translocase subunit SecG
MNVLIGLLTAIHVIVALVLIGLVLMQKSSEQGIGAAFGGGVTETVFGGGTTTALVRMTIWCAGILLATTLILAVLHSHRSGGGGSLMERTLQTAPTAPIQVPSASQSPNLPLAPSPGSTPVETPSAPSAATATEPQPLTPTPQPEAPKTP